MSKGLFIFILIVLAGCATPEPSMLSDGSMGFITTCGGTAITWSTCYEKAAKICQSEFEIVEQEQFVHGNFVKRNLYFRCTD